MLLNSQKSAPRAYRIHIHILHDSNFVHHAAVWRVSLCISMLSCLFDGCDSMERPHIAYMQAMVEVCIYANMMHVDLFHA